MKVARTGFQGKGPARRLGKRESRTECKDRIAAHGRDPAAVRSEPQETDPVEKSLNGIQRASKRP
jgi:hypothetical protein